MQATTEIKELIKGFTHREIFERVNKNCPGILKSQGTISNYFSQNGVPGMSEKTAQCIDQAVKELMEEKIVRLGFEVDV